MELSLFRELKLLEPCGMGNPVPKLLIKNCWFEDIWNKNINDFKRNKIKYSRTTFNIWDELTDDGFPGVWWGHSKDELPSSEHCDAVVELDYNAYKKRYEVRLIAVREIKTQSQLITFSSDSDYLLDWRSLNEESTKINPNASEENSGIRILKKCPQNWNEIHQEYRQAIAQDEKLALAYPPPENLSSQQIWKQLIGIAKYLSRLEKNTTSTQIKEKLDLSDTTLKLGLKALANLGFSSHQKGELLTFTWSANTSPNLETSVALFLEAVEEEQFQSQYFSQISLVNLKSILVGEINN